MSDLSPSQFGTPGAPMDTLPQVNPNQSASGTSGRAETANNEGESVLGAEARILADEGGSGPFPLKSHNLSDLASAATALANIGGYPESNPVYLATRHGLACDAVICQDGAVTSGSTTFTSSKLAPFTGSKSIIIDNAGAGNTSLITTITCTVAATGTLAATAGNTVTAACAAWGTDDTTAWNTIASSIVAGQNGTLYLPSHTLCTGQLQSPNGGALEVVGSGAHLIATGSSGAFNANIGGTVLVVASATAPAKIWVGANSTGNMRFAKLAVLSLANDSNPIGMCNNNAVVTTEYGTTQWAGRPSQGYNGSGTFPTQDAWYWGGTSTSGTGDNAPFSGYGSALAGALFANVRRASWARTYANQIFVNDPSVTNTCGAKDTLSVTDGAMTAGSPTLTCATSTPFTSGMVGDLVMVAGAGAAGSSASGTGQEWLVARISAFVSSSQVTLTQNAVNSTTAAAVHIPSAGAFETGYAYGNGVQGCSIRSPLIEVTGYTVPFIFHASAGCTVTGACLWDGSAATVAAAIFDATSQSNFVQFGILNVSGPCWPVEETPGRNTLFAVDENWSSNARIQLGGPYVNLGEYVTLTGVENGILQVGTSQATAIELIGSGGNAQISLVSSLSYASLVFAAAQYGAVIMNSHMQCTPTGTPTIAADAGAGTGATISLAGNDQRGTVTLTPAGTPAAGDLCTVTFATTWGDTGVPLAVVSPSNAAAAALGLYVVSVSASALVLGCANVPVAGTQYEFTYMTMG